VIADAVARTMATGEPFSVETDFRTAQNEYRRVQAIGEIELESGVPVALIGVFHDVIERYALEQALRDAARSMS
jgi:PAS domain-containing protein